MIKFAAALASLLMLCGCGKIDMTQAKQEVLSYDPGFGQVLQIKSELDSKIAQARSEFSRQLILINSEINKLRQELQDARKVLNTKIKDFIAQLSPEREKIYSEISDCQAQLKLKIKAAADINTMVADLEKLMQKNAANGITSADRPKWLERIKSLKSQAGGFTTETKQLECRIKILRLKLILTKQQ